MTKPKKQIGRKNRIMGIKRGLVKPENAVEWAIYHANLREKNSASIAKLHNAAVINKPSTMAGKIVIVKPHSS